MGSREQLNDVRSNRWALWSPCQAPTLFSEHLLLNLLQKGKSDNQNHKTHVARSRNGEGSSSSAQPRAPGLGNDPRGAEPPPALLIPIHCGCRERERRKNILCHACAMKNHGLLGGRRGGKAGEDLGKIGGDPAASAWSGWGRSTVLSILRLWKRASLQDKQHLGCRE